MGQFLFVLQEGKYFTESEMVAILSSSLDHINMLKAREGAETEMLDRTYREHTYIKNNISAFITTALFCKYICKSATVSGLNKQ